MEQTDIRIRAKKISDLDQLSLSDNIDFDKSYMIIGYNDGNVKKNYKVALSFIFDYVASQNDGINESELKSKVQSLIDSNDLSFPAMYGPQGPQGPQGSEGSGADIDIDEIQRQLNNLQSLINRYHKEHTIEYNLSYVYADSDNPTSLFYDESIELHFTPYNGYLMPDYIFVDGASFDYDKDERLVRIYNPTSINNKVIVSITGYIGYYAVSLTMTNINFTYISTEREKYQQGDIIELQLTPDEGYKLPTDISISNALLLNYNTNTGNLKFKVQGTGNVTISINAEPDAIYYFGFIVDIPENESNIDIDWILYNDGTIKGLSSVNVKTTYWLNSNIGCPFELNSVITVNDVGRNNEAIFIVPKIYYDPLTYTFNNGTNTGTIHDVSSYHHLESDVYCETIIDGVEYYAVYWGDGLINGTNLIIN